MNADDFEKYGVQMVQYIAQYMRELPKRPVSSNVEPGYMRGLLPKHAPTKAESFADIMKDVERVIMPGVSFMVLLYIGKPNSITLTIFMPVLFSDPYSIVYRCTLFRKIIQKLYTHTSIYPFIHPASPPHTNIHMLNMYFKHPSIHTVNH